MGRIARQKEDATGPIRLQLIGVELIAQAYVENAGYKLVSARAIVPGVRLALCMLLAISGEVFENSDYDRGRAKIKG
jgi:hypothetical protein